MSRHDTETRGAAFGKEQHNRPRASAEAALNPKAYAAKPLGEDELALISSAARQAGAVAAVSACVASGGAVVAANAFSPRFRGALGLSGKLALVVTPTLGFFYLKSHLTLAAAQADPQAFVQRQSSTAIRAVRAAPRQGDLALWQKAANAVYEAPFKTIVAIAAPLYGVIFYKESTGAATKDMMLSQRLIHTRVYGQAIAVLTTICVMGFAEGMRAEGRYRLERGHVVRGEPENQRFWYEGTEEQQAAEEEVIGAAYDDTHGIRAELLLPLVYVPAIAGLQIGLRGRVPQERLTQMVGGLIAMGLSHAGYVMFSDSSTVGGVGEEVRAR